MHAAQRSATIADVAFIAGGLALAAGVVIFVTVPSTKAKKTGVRLEGAPAVGTKAGGFVLRGSW